MAACDPMLFESAGGAVWCFAPAGRYSATNIFAEQKSSLKRNIMLKSDPSNTTETTMFHYYDFPEKERKTHLFQTMIFREGYKHVSIQQYPLVFFIVFFGRKEASTGGGVSSGVSSCIGLVEQPWRRTFSFWGVVGFCWGPSDYWRNVLFFLPAGGGSGLYVPSMFFALIHSLELRFVWSFKTHWLLGSPPNRDSRESLFGKRPSWKQGGLLQYPAFFLNGPEPSTTKKTRGVLTGVIIGLQLTPPL